MACFAPIEGTPERWQELRPLPAKERRGPPLFVAPAAAAVVLSVALQFAGPWARLLQLAVTVLVTLVAAPSSWEHAAKRSIQFDRPSAQQNQRLKLGKTSRLQS